MNDELQKKALMIRARPRRGVAMIELTVGLGVILVALSIGLVAFEQSVLARRTRERRDAARELVSLSLERARTLDRQALPKPGATMVMGVPKQLQARLPGASCELSLADGQAPAIKRLHVEVRCPGLSKPESADEIISLAPASAEKGTKP